MPPIENPTDLLRSISKSLVEIAGCMVTIQQTQAEQNEVLRSVNNRLLLIEKNWE